MKKSLRPSLFALVAVLLLTSFALEKSSAGSISNDRAPTIAIQPAQYDDPYSDFRNARYSNAGLLSERDEVKLGAQLHREVTKKFNLTDVGLVRVDRIGQR